MAQLVKLTDTLDDTIWVNPDAVMLVEPRYTTNGIHGTQITLQSGREIGVEEDMRTVKQKVTHSWHPIVNGSFASCINCKHFVREGLICPERGDEEMSRNLFCECWERSET